jgi:hypothetical protein
MPSLPHLVLPLRRCADRVDVMQPQRHLASRGLGASLLEVRDGTKRSRSRGSDGR